MRHLWSRVWIALRWFWSFREAVAGSLSDARIAVSSAKVAVVVAGEVGRSAMYDIEERPENTALWNTGVDW
jgi:hypothetical protein